MEKSIVLQIICLKYNTAISEWDILINTTGYMVSNKHGNCLQNFTFCLTLYKVLAVSWIKGMLVSL